MVGNSPEPRQRPIPVPTCRAIAIQWHLFEGYHLMPVQASDDISLRQASDLPLLRGW